MREAIRDSARYLRGVRPIDPDELTDYVEGPAASEAITDHLRAMAVDLGLVERTDGTFVPVEDGPVEPVADEVETLPAAYERQLEAALEEAHGPDWAQGPTGDRLRETIRQLKADYLAQRDVTYDRDTALGYAVYHLAPTYAATRHVLADLAADGLLSRRLRVLDVGAGVGGPALAVHDCLFGPPGDTGTDTPSALVGYYAIEPSAAADLFETLVEPTDRNFHVTVERSTAEAFDPTDSYDLLLFANVLSELDEAAAVLERYLAALDATGTVLLIAPADRNTATGLKAVERRLESRTDATVYGPGVRLWPNHVPTDGGWGFAVGSDLEAPSVQVALDSGDRAALLDERHPDDEPGGGEFVNVDVQYVHGVLRKDGRTAIEWRPDPTRTAKMAEMDRHVTDRIDVSGVKLSHDLGEDNPVFRVGDGSQAVDHFAVLVERSALNEDLLAAAYGDCLRFTNVLVLWNEDEGAYNLVVDEETIVDLVARRAGGGPQ